jgi:hypothetical protein
MPETKSLKRAGESLAKVLNIIGLLGVILGLAVAIIGLTGAVQGAGYMALIQLVYGIAGALIGWGLLACARYCEIYSGHVERQTLALEKCGQGPTAASPTVATPPEEERKAEEGA